jgi:hypothetical protein
MQLGLREKQTNLVPQKIVGEIQILKFLEFRKVKVFRSTFTKVELSDLLTLLKIDINSELDGEPKQYRFYTVEIV